MAEAGVDVTFTPPDLIQRLHRYPQKVDEVVRMTTEASMVHIHGEVPPYPAGTGHDTSGRTGQLGRSLGSSQAGGILGQPAIYQLRKLGMGQYEGKVGTNLWYADRVIGNQEPPWSAYWWNVTGWAKKASKGVLRLFEQATQKLAAYIDGKG